MANQMIALGARAPQVNVLGPAIQQGAQMINMMRQQDAAARQAAVAQQQMQLAQAKEQREASAAEIEMAGKKLAYHTSRAPIVQNQAGYQLWLNAVGKDSPEMVEFFTTNLPPQDFSPEKLIKLVGSVNQVFNATYGPRETEVVQDEKGDTFVAVTGGFGPQGIVPLNQFKPSAAGARPPAPAATAPSMGAAPPAGPAARATRGVNTTPQDLIQQGIPLNRIPMGNPLQPMSMGAAPQPDLGAMVQTMMDTGVVSQSDFEAMRAAAGPGKDEQLAQILRANNIRIMPNEQAPEGMRSAVYRPEEGAPTLQQTQSLQGYEDTGVQFRGKPPMQSPTPGVYNVPTPVIREKAKAERRTPQETYEETRSTKQAESDVKFLEGFGAARESAQQALSVIRSMIGDAQLDENGRITIKGRQAPHPGFEDVVGATWRPGARFIPGTDAAGFDAYLEQVEGGAFLEAYERLKGTGQITEIEGQKATRAITRMKRSVSEPEFVKAAREFEGIIRSALSRGEQRAARLRGGEAGAKQPASTKGGRELRYNPATGDFD